MQYEEMTLNHVFREKEFHGEHVSKIEIKEKVRELQNKVYQKEPRLKWKKVLDEVMGTSSRLLNIKIKDILESAWKKYQEVEKYLDAEKYNTDEVFLVPLLEHTILSEHHPKIEIRVGEVHLGDIDFEIKLKLLLSGIILKISHAKIEGVKTGKFKTTGTFSCEGIILFQDETREFEF